MWCIGLHFREHRADDGKVVAINARVKASNLHANPAAHLADAGLPAGSEDAQAELKKVDPLIAESQVTSSAAPGTAVS